MPLLRSRFLSAAASLAAAVLLGATVSVIPASATSTGDGNGVQGNGAQDSAFSAAASGPVPDGEPTMPEPAAADRFIVKFANDAGRTTAERAEAYEEPAEELGTEVQEVRATATGARVVTTDRKLEPAEAADLVAELEADPAVEYAEPDLLLKPAAPTPNDSHYGLQWDFSDPEAGPVAFAGMNVPAAWDVSRGHGTVVAVVDTGITAHRDLDVNVLPGYDMISYSGTPDDAVDPRDGDGRDGDPADEGDWYAEDQCGRGTGSSVSSWHGTHVAGTIAAVTGNGEGVAGVAPEAKILPVRALGSCGGYMSDISDGIIWAAGGAVLDGKGKLVPANDHPADVINLSLGGLGQCPATLQGAVDAAVAAGSVVVAAAGNESMDARYSTPANCDHVIVVAASGPDGSLAGYSNFGKTVDVTAPGGNFDAGNEGGILSTTNTGPTVPRDGGDDYNYAEGTSSAAPHVSGLAALLLSAKPGLSAEEVELRLKASTRPVSGACIAGLVDATAALASRNDPLPGAFTAGSPSITGTGKVGATLTAVPGTWSPNPAAYGYQWYSNGKPVASATGSRYALTGAEAGKRISVCVTARATGYSTALSQSSPTASVAQGTLASSTPTIGGTRKVGYALTARAGTWTAGTRLTYKWYRSGKVISGATKSTYRLAGADAGQRVTVKVTGTRTGYAMLSRVSAKTATIAKGTLQASTPTVKGTPKVGSRLTAHAGTWTAGTKLAYQWYRSGTKIKGATKSAYRLAKSDRNRTIKVRVTGTKTGYTTVRQYSRPVSRIR